MNSTTPSRWIGHCIAIVTGRCIVTAHCMAIAHCLALVVGTTATADEFVVSPVNDQIPVSTIDWPWWRGPYRNGYAVADQDPPRTWSDNDDGQTNIVWKVPVPGRGHASPIVVGESVYLATADRERDVQTVLSFDRGTGELNWEKTIHRGGLMEKNKKASQASSTLAWDGERLFVSFLNDGGVHTTAMTSDGERVWQTRISDYVIHQGYAASPNVYQHLVILNADNKGGGAIVALERATGKEVWRQPRPKIPNYPSPVILNVAGKDQMIMIGGELVSSFDPLTGEKNWEIAGATQECVTSTVTDGVHIFSSGGWPENHVAAIKADGTGEIVWQNRSRVYVPSMLMRNGFLFAVLDAGVAVCWKSDTGQEIWKSRLGGDFSSSPVMVGELIYATNEVGETFVYEASAERFRLVAKNKLGDSVFATPAVCAGRIYHRVAFQEGEKRQEYLYCIGDGQARPTAVTETPSE